MRLSTYVDKHIIFTYTIYKQSKRKRSHCEEALNPKQNECRVRNEFASLARLGENINLYMNICACYMYTKR